MTNAPGPFRGAPARTPARASATASGTSAGTSGPPFFWRLLASSWLLLLLFPAGGAAWLAFGVLAIVGRRRSWGIIAGVYTVLALIVQVLPDPAGNLAQGTLYLVILLHGLIINQGWLLLLWSRRENDLTIFGNPRGGRSRPAPARSRQRAAAVPKEAEALLGGGGTARSDYLDESAPAAPAPRRRRRTTQQPPAAAAQPPVAAEPIDVNTANQRTLAKLTGMDRASAKAAITERTKRGGFASLEDFAATAGLQPHEMMRLTGEAFCSPRPRSKRSFGRRVDY